MNEWKITTHASGLVSIAGHRWPDMARVVLLDDIKKIIYAPRGSNAYDDMLYHEVPYPVSHTCAVEEETITAWVRAQELVRQLGQVHCPECGKGFMGVGVFPSDPVPLCRKCHEKDRILQGL